MTRISILAVRVCVVEREMKNQIKTGLSIYQDLTRRYLKSFNPIDVPASACSEGKVQMKKAEISG